MKPKQLKITYSIMPDYGSAYGWGVRGEYRRVGIGGNMADTSGWRGDVPISDSLHQAFAEWQQVFERFDVYDPDMAANFDWAAFHERSLELTRRLKAEVGDAAAIVYVKPHEDPNHEVDEWMEVLTDGTLVAIPK